MLIVKEARRAKLNKPMENKRKVLFKYESIGVDENIGNIDYVLFLCHKYINNYSLFAKNLVSDILDQTIFNILENFWKERKCV